MVAPMLPTSPHAHAAVTTARTMWTVTLCLLPAAAWGVLAFGPRALLVLGLAVGASAFAELAIGLTLKRPFLLDGSAVLTGLLLGMALPSQVNLLAPVVAGVVATGLAKWAFGGLGANWVNPALAGWLVVFFAWPEGMVRWVDPTYFRVTDAVSSATALHTGTLRATVGGGWGASLAGFWDRLMGEGTYAAGLVNALVGNRAGPIGAVSSLLLIAAIVYLGVARTLAWQIPVVYIGTVAVLALVGGGPQAIAVHVLGGGLLLGGVMASDPVTSPCTPPGRIAYAAGCGVLTYLIRAIGVYPDGVAFAVVLMNALTPAIDRVTRRRGRSPRGGQR